MGKWAKSLFGREKFDRVGLVIAGTISPKFERRVLALFDKVVSSKDAVYHGHLAKKGGHYYPILTNVYGAPAIMDSLTEMYDGGCRNIIFVGYAYGGFKANLDVGSYTLPTKAYHFDGIYSPLDTSRTMSLPNKELRAKLKQVLDKGKVPYVKGSNISVPSVTFQLPHENIKYKAIKPRPVSLEMELAACFSRARDIGMRAAGVLIVSDNRTSSIGDENKSKLRKQAKLNVLRYIVNNLSRFRLPALKTKRRFDIDEQLASIIEDPEDLTNIYRKK